MSERRLKEPSYPDAQRQEPSEDARILLACNRRFYEAFEKLDLDLMDKVWAHHDAVSCMHPSPGWSLLRGWHEVRQSWEQIFSRIRMVRFELSDIRVVMAHGLSWIILTERLRAFAYDSDEEIREATVATNLFERGRSSWRLLHHHATLLVEEPLPEETVESAVEAFRDVPLQPNERDTIKRQREKASGKRRDTE